MSAHTPGPWLVTRSPRFLGQWGVGTDLFSGAVRVGDQAIAIVAHDGMCEEASEANARLITAAPELLEALKWMVEHDETNEGDTPLPDHHGLTWNEINAEFIAGLNAARAAIAKATGADA